MDANGNTVIWKYLELLSVMSCLELPSILSFSYGNLMFDDNQLFLMGKDTSTSPSFHLYKINFSTNSYTWAKRIIWSSICSPYLSESILSNDNSKIYSLFPLESPAYLYFITLNSYDGSVIDSRYRSSISWSQSLGSAKSSNVLLFTVTCSSTYYMIMYDTNSLAFTVKQGVNISMLEMAVESTTGR